MLTKTLFIVGRIGIWLCIVIGVASFAAHAENGSRPGGADQVDDRSQTRDPPPSRETSPSDEGSSVERGRYIVHQVAMCVICHTPKDAAGNLDQTRLLRGGPIPVRGPTADSDWAFHAPQLAGLPGWEDDAVVTLLMTGHRPNGKAPRPPMPPFRFHQEDARAVVDYLKSLN
ncbi:MAG: c-type cytochrome [Pirellulaceae bacterium]